MDWLIGIIVVVVAGLVAVVAYVWTSGFLFSARITAISSSDLMMMGIG